MRKVLPLTVVLAATCHAAAVTALPLVVAGTGDPHIDVPAVQAAVDRGGQVVLMGHFSFDIAPSKPAGAIYSRTVTVSKEVVISGKRDAHGEMPAIEGGFFPFFVDAPQSPVTIRGLRFVRPKGAAIWTYAVNGLTIDGCRIEGVEPSAALRGYAGIGHPVATAIFVGSNPVPPKAGQEEQAENNSGALLIFNNDIDVGGTAGDQTLGICIFGVGKSPDKTVDLKIFGNKIRNITERGINVNEIGGRAHIERNVITTGVIAGPSNGVQPDVIHAVGSGLYRIANNSIVSEWATGAGIRVQGSDWSPEARATVLDNDITMSAPEGTVFGANSAAIELRGSTQGNAVRNNRIRGRARAALAVVGQNGGMPLNNTFASNDVKGFEAPVADAITREHAGRSSNQVPTGIQ